MRMMGCQRVLYVTWTLGVIKRTNKLKWLSLQQQEQVFYFSLLSFPFVSFNVISLKLFSSLFCNFNSQVKFGFNFSNFLVFQFKFGSKYSIKQVNTKVHSSLTILHRFSHVALVWFGLVWFWFNFIVFIMDAISIICSHIALSNSKLSLKKPA